ncbi:DUF323-domain-containing protein [Dentipellis sp. KUC8613]|nr:DUF323-domain-containing protein [Dentipellis sp. KUC8613]
MSAMSSSSSFSEPSTAPSTPPPVQEREKRFLLCSPDALKDVGAKMGNSDTLFFLSGVGSSDEIRSLLDKGTDGLGEEILFASEWEPSGSGDYYESRASPALPMDKDSLLDLSTLQVSSPILTHADALALFTAAHLALTIAYHTPTLHLYVLSRPPFVFPLISSTPATPVNPTAHPFGVPSTSDWEDLWKAWDCVTMGMIPRAMLHQKPIDLRHKCLFYLGHIPTFVDMLLSKLLDEPNTEPKKFVDIFERGIDPHVDDPEHCHRHSEVPTRDEDWPSLAEIVAFRDRVRARLLALYADLESGRRALSRRMARTLVMTFEHEGFHIETLLYMLIQRAGTGTLPPPGFKPPPFAALAEQWRASASASSLPSHSTTVTLGPADVVLGHDDPELDDLRPELAGDATGRAYGWDNESPARTVAVRPFRIARRPVTNGEYAAWWEAGGRARAPPPSWVVAGTGEIGVRTLFGLVGMDVAREWPVLAAYDDLCAYAQAQGGRVPREEELRLFLDRFEVGYAGGGNVGFRNWHPVPATMGGEEEGVRGSNGGVWEWTATVLEEHEGFDATTIFPGYSSDFFDTKHQVVLGASYATIPRLAGRRTVRNFYQHNYPYPWVGARVAFDV